MGEANWGRFHHIDSPRDTESYQSLIPARGVGGGQPQHPLLGLTDPAQAASLSYLKPGGVFLLSLVMAGRKCRSVTRCITVAGRVARVVFGLLWWQSYWRAREVPAPTAQRAWVEKARGVLTPASQTLVLGSRVAITLQRQVSDLFLIRKYVLT